MRIGTLVLALVMAVAGGLVGAGERPAAAGERPAVAADASLAIAGSPFDPDGDGRRERVRITVTTSSPADVTLRILDFDGRRVKTIAPGTPLNGTRRWTWKGRDERGRKVPYGPYRVAAIIRDADGVRSPWAWITRARRVPYPIRPGAITVAIDPGHGGPAAGAVWKRVPEDRVNLDIGLRLEAMLKGAGIGVVMTRRRDRNVSPVGKDLNGDHRYSRLDELIARNDIANQHRADIHLAVHNNASACHCRRGTEMYTHFGRSWTREGRRLARALLREHLWHLDRVASFSPRGRGVKGHDFKALEPYHRMRMPRPSLQPSVLGESLFLDHPAEHRVLTTRAGRTAIAAAYFDGIARYLAWRPYGLRYHVLETMRQAPPGAHASTRVRLTNTGRRSSAGWKLVARVVEQVRRYDGRPRRGAVVAKVPVPDGLAPGASVEVALPRIPLPGVSGRWLVKLDVNLPGGDSLAKHGVVGPQLRVETVVR